MMLPLVFACRRIEFGATLLHIRRYSPRKLRRQCPIPPFFTKTSSSYSKHLNKSIPYIPYFLPLRPQRSAPSSAARLLRKRLSAAPSQVSLSTPYSVQHCSADSTSDAPQNNKPRNHNHGDSHARKASRHRRSSWRLHR